MVVLENFIDIYIISCHEYAVNYFNVLKGTKKTRTKSSQVVSNPCLVQVYWPGALKYVFVYSSISA